jgi:hypothetical protein
VNADPIDASVPCLTHCAGVWNPMVTGTFHIFPPFHPYFKIIIIIRVEANSTVNSISKGGGRGGINTWTGIGFVAIKNLTSL